MSLFEFPSRAWNWGPPIKFKAFVESRLVHFLGKMETLNNTSTNWRWVVCSFFVPNSFWAKAWNLSSVGREWIVTAANLSALSLKSWDNSGRISFFFKHSYPLDALAFWGSHILTSEWTTKVTFGSRNGSSVRGKASHSSSRIQLSLEFTRIVLGRGEKRLRHQSRFFTANVVGYWWASFIHDWEATKSHVWMTGKSCFLNLEPTNRLLPMVFQHLALVFSDGRDLMSSRDKSRSMLTSSHPVHTIVHTYVLQCSRYFPPMFTTGIGYQTKVQLLSS